MTVDDYKMYVFIDGLALFTIFNWNARTCYQTRDANFKLDIVLPQLVRCITVKRSEISNIEFGPGIVNELRKILFFSAFCTIMSVKRETRKVCQYK